MRPSSPAPCGIPLSIQSMISWTSSRGMKGPRRGIRPEVPTLRASDRDQLRVLAQEHPARWPGYPRAQRPAVPPAFPSNMHGCPAGVRVPIAPSTCPLPRRGVPSPWASRPFSRCWTRRSFLPIRFHILPVELLPVPPALGSAQDWQQVVESHRRPRISTGARSPFPAAVVRWRGGGPAAPPQGTPARPWCCPGE